MTTRRTNQRRPIQMNPHLSARRPLTGPFSWSKGGLSVAATVHLATHYVMPTIRPPSLASTIPHTTRYTPTTTPTSLCMKALAGAIALIGGGTRIGPKGNTDRTRDYPDLLKNHPDVVNTIVSFTLAVRTVDQLRALEERLSACHCDTTNPAIQALHTVDHGLGATASPSQALSRALFCFLCDLAQFTSGSLYRSTEKVEHRNKRDKALREFSHYVLDDAQAALDSASSWFGYHHTRDHHVLSFVEECLVRYHTFHTTTSSPSGQQLIALAALELHQKIVDLPSGIDLATTEAQYRKENGDTLQTYASFISHFLSTERPPPHPMVLGLIHHTSVKFFDIFEHLDSADKEFLQDLDVPQILANISVCTLLFIDEPMIEVTHMAKVLDRTWWGKDLTEAINLSYYHAWCQLLRCVDEERCFNPACARAPTGRKFSRCARCGVPSYCSKECQKASWAHSQFPHKDICRDWAKLSKVWLINPDPDKHRSLLPAEGKIRWNEELKAAATLIGIDEDRIKELGVLGVGDLGFGKRCYMVREGSDSDEGAVSSRPEYGLPGAIDIE